MSKITVVEAPTKQIAAAAQGYGFVTVKVDHHHPNRPRFDVSLHNKLSGTLFKEDEPKRALAPTKENLPLKAPKTKELLPQKWRGFFQKK